MKFFKQYFGVKHQLREIEDLLVQIRKENMQEFENLKEAVTFAVETIVAAVERISSSPSGAEIQAEADRVRAAADSLAAALNPPTP